MPGASCVVRLVDAQSDAFSEPGPPYRLDRVEEHLLGAEAEEGVLFPETDMEANVFRDKRLKKLVPRGDVETCEEACSTRCSPPPWLALPGGMVVARRRGGGLRPSRRRRDPYTVSASQPPIRLMPPYGPSFARDRSW